jgi:hypothetical protein
MNTSLFTTLLTDWQALVSFGLGLAALAYVSKRWWPAVANLLGHAPHGGKAGAAASQGPCGQGTGGPASALSSAAPASACSSACGNCGQSGTVPVKDHRVRIVKRVTH